MITLLITLGLLLLILIVALFTTSLVMVIEYVVPTMFAIWVASLCYKLIQKWFKPKKKKEEES